MQPTQEQHDALSLFATRKSLRIDAYAGAGKTSTLVLLAQSRATRGLYLAFNRSIAADAQSRFPPHVRCATSHSMAFRGVRRSLGYPDRKLTDKLTAQGIAEAFRMPEVISFHCGIELSRQSFASVLLGTVTKYMQSAEARPATSHVPRYGLLEQFHPAQFASFAEQAAAQAGFLWDAMCHRSGGPPLGHDGYLKLWALSHPHPRVDYLLIDEAQDLNPVLLDVFRQAECQVIYAGDQYQQIYEWRGAVNAMQQAETPHRTLLAQSFRFGPEIAAAASSFYANLGLAFRSAVFFLCPRKSAWFVLTRS